MWDLVCDLMLRLVLKETRVHAAQIVQEASWVVGRVVSDAAAEGGSSSTALGEAGVMLEGTREAADGARVRLDLTNLVAGPQAPGFRLFPGQVGAALLPGVGATVEIVVVLTTSYALHAYGSLAIESALGCVTCFEIL